MGKLTMEDKELSYSEARDMLESTGVWIVDDSEYFIITKMINDPTVRILYYKSSGYYEVRGFGIGFETYPIYDKWKIMINAWRREYGSVQV